jgi:hypothetical protein
MRYLEPDELLRLVAAALRERVAPDCGPQARGQVWAAIGLLENLATRVVERPGVDGDDDAARLDRLDAPEGWQRALEAARRREAIDRERRRPTNFGEIFRRD